MEGLVRVGCDGQGDSGVVGRHLEREDLHHLAVDLDGDVVVPPEASHLKGIAGGESGVVVSGPFILQELDIPPAGCVGLYSANRLTGTYT